MGSSHAHRTPHGDSALLSLLGHDLRTPLGPLMLAVSSIAVDPGAPEDVRDLARMAEAQAARVGRLMEAATAAQAGSRRPVREVLDLGDIVAAAAANMRALGFDCDVRFAPSPILGDRALLETALTCLLEAASGEEDATAAVVCTTDDRALVAIRGPKTEQCAESLRADGPSSAHRALVLGAQEMLAAHGGAAVAVAGTLTAWIPFETA